MFSRMPGELGTFLALTGERLTEQDLYALQLARYRSSANRIDLRNELTQSLLQNRPMHTVLEYGNMYQEQRIQQMKG